MAAKRMQTYYISSSESDNSDQDNDERTTQKKFKNLKLCETSPSNEQILNGTLNSNTSTFTSSQANNHISKDNDDKFIYISNDDDHDTRQKLSSSQNLNMFNQFNDFRLIVSSSKERNNDKDLLYNKDSIVTAGNKSDTLITTATPKHTQSLIPQYFHPQLNGLQNIVSITEDTLKCKVIWKSFIRYFGNTNKVFDGIVCDMTGEINLVCFNQDVDKFYDMLVVNKTFKIQNAKFSLAQENYRTTYSPYQIQLISNTILQPYNCLAFRPLMKINKELLINICQKVHGTYLDVEGIVVGEQLPITTTSVIDGHLIRRKNIKIKDETGIATITFWSHKIDQLPDKIKNKTLRIRNGRVNHYGDHITINISHQTIFEIVN